MRRRYKTFLRERNQFSASGTETLLSVSEYYGVKPRAEAFVGEEHESRAASLEGYRIVRKGDLVMNYMLAWKGAYGASDHDGIVSPAYAVFEVDQSIANLRFLHHRTRSDHTKTAFRSRSKGIIESRLRLYPDSFLAMDLDLPDLPTQKAIADFLDRETARIDQLIKKKQRMVEVLGEKLAAQLQYTVLAGAKLSRNPEGDWLSDLSNDWRLFPIKHMVRIVGGATPSKEREDYWIGPIPWVSPKDMKRDTISATSHCISEMALANSPVSIVPKGAVLIVVRGMILARLVPVCRLGCNATINQDMKALTSRGNIISNHYLHRMLQGFQDVIMSFVDEAAHGTKTLRSDRFFSLKFPVPPFELQTNLVVEYDKQKRLMDAIIEKIESSIYRLREFRSALITAAVTGQIDVSTWSKKGMTERRFDQIEEATSA